ncbi:MAG: hypothetical protein ACXVB4_08220 [Pseudobdellovibrionaceae bacterium]
MKNVKYFLNTVLILGVLAGCASQWNQDPLSGVVGPFQTAQDKPTNVEAPKPIESNNVVVETADFYSFREGIEGELAITARILESDYVPTISVENLSDFPGASLTVANYDSATRVLTAKFSWTPALGTVSGNSSLEDKKDIKLLVLGNKPDSLVLTRHLAVKVSVGKTLSTPEIFSISERILETREGETSHITLKVRDKDAGSDAKSYPQIQVQPIFDKLNLSSFVKLSEPVLMGNNEFTIYLTLDLSAAELTKSRGSFGFTLKAISRFNQISEGQDIHVTVFTSFSKLQSTWFDTLEVTGGIKKEFQFIFFDPKVELSVMSPTFNGLPQGATIDCKKVAANQLCTFSWTPDLTAPAGEFSIHALVSAKNSDPQDSLVKDTNFNLKLRVIPAPTPPPSPTPSPTPAPAPTPPENPLPTPGGHS